MKGAFLSCVLFVFAPPHNAPPVELYHSTTHKFSQKLFMQIYLSDTRTVQSFAEFCRENQWFDA